MGIVIEYFAGKNCNYFIFWLCHNKWLIFDEK